MFTFFRKRWFRRTLIGIFAIFLFAIAAYLTVIRPWHLHWGATEEEVNRSMPGDSLVSDASLNTTRAITIRARPEQIWPWLVQMGPGRGGWYSYDVLDNGGRSSAQRIVPEWQVALKPGDSLGIGSGPKFYVMQVEANRYLVLGPKISWAIALYPQTDSTTRLVERLRSHYYWNSFHGAMFAVCLDIGDFIMMRKMLLTLKERVERNLVQGKRANSPGRP